MFWKDPRFAKAMIIFGYLMIGVYIFAGLYIALSDRFLYISQNMRFVFAGFLVVYGFFRGVRMYYKNKRGYAGDELQ